MGDGQTKYLLTIVKACESKANVIESWQAKKNLNFLSRIFKLHDQ